MNDLSATIAGAASIAAMMGALVLATLSRPGQPPALQQPTSPWSRALDADARGLRGAGPLFEDCALLEPDSPPASPNPVLRLLASTPVTTDPAPLPGADAPQQSNDAADDCTADATDDPGVGGLGSGWIISADGVMQMNPYGLSDTHSIKLRAPEPLREFKSRILGLDGGRAMPKDAPRPPETPRPRKPLIVLEGGSHGAAPDRGLGPSPAAVADSSQEARPQWADFA